MLILPYKSEHMDELERRGALGWLSAFLTPQHKKNLEGTYAFTAIAKDGHVVGCAGVAKYWHNRGEAWAIIDQNSRPDFIGLHHAVKRFLDVCPFNRVEAAVDIGFHAGHRWVKLLGFELEAPLVKAFRPDGHDCSLYARVRIWRQQQFSQQ